MIILSLFLLATLAIVIFPMLVPYMLLSYMFIDGVASRHFINNLKMSAGGINVYFPDLLYASSFILAVIGVIRLLFAGKLHAYSLEVKLTLLLVVGYFLFFTAKFSLGFFNGVPADSLVRRYAIDTQCVYLFVPLLYLRSEETLKRLLYFVVIVSLIFPLIQPFLYGSADQVALQIGQGGTLRLGFGNANLFLMLGVLALFVWEKKLWLSALPLSGIAMLAQRSAFISLALCVFVVAILKKKSLKYIVITGMVGLLLIATLLIIQTTTSVPVVDKAIERASQTFEETGSTKARILVIPQALHEIGVRPLLGYSYSELYFLSQKQDGDAFAFNMLHPHNFVLSSFLRSGAIGTIILFSTIFLVMKSSIKLIKQSFTKEQGIYLFSTILFFVVFGVMNTSFFSAGYVYWILSGICLWYRNMLHTTNSEQAGTSNTNHSCSKRRILKYKEIG